MRQAADVYALAPFSLAAALGPSSRFDSAARELDRDAILFQQFRADQSDLAHGNHHP
jgi:hypothetical protein